MITLVVMMMLRMRHIGLNGGMGRAYLRRKVKRKKKKMKVMRKRMMEMRRNQPKRLCPWFSGPDMPMAVPQPIIMGMA